MQNFFITILLLMALPCWAQQRETDQGESVTYIDVSGSALLFGDWKAGIVRFNSGRSTDQFKIKFDCIQHKLLLQFNGSAFSTESKVKEFVLKSSSSDTMLFRNGFPAFEKETEASYYQVLYQGHSMLLCLHFKEVVYEGQLVAKTVYRRIKDVNRLIVYQKGQMFEIKGDKLLIPESFPANKEALQQFIAEQGLKFRDHSDYIKLIRFYDSIVN